MSFYWEPTRRAGLGSESQTCQLPNGETLRFSVEQDGTGAYLVSVDRLDKQGEFVAAREFYSDDIT